MKYKSLWLASRSQCTLQEEQIKQLKESVDNLTKEIKLLQYSLDSYKESLDSIEEELAESHYYKVRYKKALIILKEKFGLDINVIKLNLLNNNLYFELSEEQSHLLKEVLENDL